MTGTGVATRVEPGTYADYVALERWHYRAGPPATSVRTLRAVHDGQVVGVLVVSMPTLNGRWRAVAWPDLFALPLGRRRAAHLLNQSVRTISRVIVDPRFRGTGVAVAMVRAYLRDPLSTHTEAVAAMGGVSPFFRRAGMRRVELLGQARDAHLRAVLRDLGVRPWELVDLTHSGRILGRAEVRRAIERWANQSCATRRLRADPCSMGVAAASALCAPASVFVYP